MESLLTFKFLSIFFSGRQTRDDRSQEEQGHYKQKFDFQTEKSVCHVTGIFISLLDALCL
jgi:hypothetical protein